MITNQKLKKSLEEIKNITSFDAILYSAKGKHLTGTVEEPEHSDIFVKEFIVSEEDVREKNDAVAFAVEIDSELEYVLVMFKMKRLFLSCGTKDAVTVSARQWSWL